MNFSKLVLFILIILSFNSTSSNSSWLSSHINPIVLTPDLTIKTLMVDFYNIKEKNKGYTVTTLPIPINTPFSILVLHLGDKTISQFLKFLMNLVNNNAKINHDIQILVDFLRVCMVTNRSWIAQKLLVGSGSYSDNKKYTYPRLALLDKVFNILTIAGHEDMRVADACYSLLLHSSNNPGGLSEIFSHMILASINNNMNNSHENLSLITQSIINNITIKKVENPSMKKTCLHKNNNLQTTENIDTSSNHHSSRISRYQMKAIPGCAILLAGISACYSLVTMNEADINTTATNSSQAKYNFSENEYPCLDNNECIQRLKVCNSNYDLQDLSDESMTSCNKHCAHDRFKYKNTNKCIDSTYICDDLSDCRDNSDVNWHDKEIHNINRSITKPCDSHKGYDFDKCKIELRSSLCNDLNNNFQNSTETNQTEINQTKINQTETNQTNRASHTQQNSSILKSLFSSLPTIIISCIGIAGTVAIGALYTYYSYEKTFPKFKSIHLGKYKELHNSGCSCSTHNN